MTFGPPAQTGVPSPRQLTEAARRLASEHLGATPDPRTRRTLLPLLTTAGRNLTRAYETFGEAVGEGAELSPGSHWILDNFYVLSEQHAEVSRHLRGRFFSELPTITEGPFAGYPRIYPVVVHLLETLDNEVQADTLTRYLKAYQTVCPLTLGELWAVPDTLRLSLIQNLGKLATEMLDAYVDRRSAEAWAERIRDASARDPLEGMWEVRAMVDELPQLSDPFAQALSERLQPDPGAAAVVEWLERRLEARATSLSAVARLTTQRQVSVAHAVSTLRESAEAEWYRIIESVSLTERVLRRDPARIYGRMDPETRDRYRHVVEDLARYSDASEVEVARAAIERSHASYQKQGTGAGGSHRNGGDGDRSDHVGYHLIGPGSRAFESALPTRPPLGQRLKRVLHQRPQLLYLGALAVVTTAAEIGILQVAQGRGVSFILLVSVLVTALLPCFDLAVAFTNRLVAWIVPPRPLPKMDRDVGVGPDDRALVVVPTLLRSPEDARAQVQALEIHAHANPSSLLRYALLSDFTDAENEHEPGDRETLLAARAAIVELNERERDDWGDRFFLLHRHRFWSETEQRWMGWERKRGKIEDLNILLREPHSATSYSVFEGDFFGVTADDRIRYVIALDADTRMPPDTAIDLIRTAVHPLNRPILNPEGVRVVEGYGILQPRVSISPESASRTWFARVFSGNVGLDPYTTAVSDVYQDLFREGIYTGKGLYDVDAFAQVLSTVVPTETVLSHDLLESTYGRAALVTDIEVYDDYPGDFVSYAKRLHRWVRGDWQIAGWLRPSYGAADGSRQRNPISVLGRWQILDNIRRSLNAPAMLLFLLAGWIALPRSHLFWTGVALAILAFPVYVNLTAAVFSRPKEARWSSYFAGVGRDLRLNLVQTGLTITFLAHTALYALDAIARVVWRMAVSRRGLLEWQTATDVERSESRRLVDYFRFMWPSVAWSGTALALVIAIEPRGLVAAGPFLLAWLVAPWVAWRLGEPVQRVKERLTPEDRAWLRRFGRRTWSYFEDHMDAGHLWLPPDNVQEYPYRGAAPRTSPTNVGLGLLAARSAADFGWIGEDQWLDYMEDATGSIDRLETYAGHLLNWYATRTGATLWPRYVSTVDSGNFVASLITVEQALLHGDGERWPSPELARGLRDTLALLQERLTEAEDRSDEDDHEEVVEDEGPASEAKKWVARLAAIVSEASSDQIGTWLDLLDRSQAIIGPNAPSLSTPDAHTILDDAARGEPSALGSIPAAIDRTVTFLERQRAEFAALVPWWVAGDPIPEAVTTARSRSALRGALENMGPGDPRSGEALAAVRARDARRSTLAAWCSARIRATDFSMLYDRTRGLFSVGFDIDTLSADPSAYDLLASEARLGSYIAIAHGQVPPTHWFRLGRPTGDVEGGNALLSWGGTMFEYLMPLLFTASWPGTLLDESYQNAVLTQRRYGVRHARPWGVSESAYNALNLALDYQYRAFGVPGLGLQRGLGKDAVVAPYASALALMVLPVTALSNLRRLEQEEAWGTYGFYDAIDYTPSRLPSGETRVVVQNWMAHHLGMSLLAVANVLDDQRVQRRFRASPAIQAVELLLQERIPKRIETIDPHPMEATVDSGGAPREDPPVLYVPVERLKEPSPVGGLLSNGRYSVLMTQAGTGYSRYGDWQLTRWRADRTCDHDGTFFYIRDLDSGLFWSVTPEPIPTPADRVDTWFHLSKIESALVRDWIETFVEVCVSPEDDVEIRRLTITNYGTDTRRLDVTSYVEVVLNQAGADRAHPAFSKLFVQTESIPGARGLLATRRPREHDAERLWMFHTVDQETTSSQSSHGWEFETDRARFIGRQRSVADPEALQPGARLTGTLGAVLDPILSIRRPIELGPQEKAVVTFTIGVASTREEAVGLADRYDNPTAAQRAIDLASAYGPVEAEHMAISGEEALRIQALGVALVYADPRLRAPAEVIARNRKQQSGLWGYGISGDLPLIVVRVSSMDQMDEVREAIRAFEYLRLRGLDLDLVFLNLHPPSYLEGLQDLITQATHTSGARSSRAFKGRMYVLRADQVPNEDLDLILSVARGVFSGDLQGWLRAEAGGGPFSPRLETPGRTADRDELGASDDALPERSDLTLDNGFGGYAPDGSYVIRGRLGLDARPTPLPWINVVANPSAGFIASESGGGFTWSMNSHENRLSTWSNDPVTDPPSEVVYVRDDATGLYGSATPSPAPLPGEYETTHAFGRTSYRHRGAGLDQELTLFMAGDDPVKALRLRIRNTTTEPRTLSVFHYHEWVLGVYREDSARHVQTELDPETGALFAVNHYNQEFAGRVAFAQVVAPEGATTDFTGDRHAFLGRGGTVTCPLAVRRDVHLDGRVGPGLDPCAGWRVSLSLAPGEEAHLAFIVGEGRDAESARELVGRYATLDRVDASLAQSIEDWRRRVGVFEVHTPSAALDHALDGWLLYQALSCRVWGRSALYQSGGAFGFRDQLQDVMALVYVDPALTRDQILIHASHQFVEGDVLHWWHPPTDRGVRTRFSDDLLWLPYVTCFYVAATGDTGVFEERTPYLTARALEEGEQEAYLVPERSHESGDLYDHCCRALDRSLTTGSHGLPLMGAGDWNDGMNRVGLNGGESVWLGFFLHTILRDFLPHCEARGDTDRVERYSEYRARLGEALNDAGWDGSWYRRAYYGDGTPLGSAQNLECRIDAIAQGWSVISGVAPPERARAALAAVNEHLVDAEGRLIRLLTPPFDESERDPGYIKGYPPGVRENGGQYTHGVLWAIQAMAEIGDLDRAVELFEMIAPAGEATTRKQAERYKVEPFVSAADVYSVEPHVGRGGWTWYTGSASWLMRVALESILGFTLHDGEIRLAPVLPAGWPGFRITYRPSPDSEYQIVVERSSSAGDGSAQMTATLDGSELPTESGVVRLPVHRDGSCHVVLVRTYSTDRPEG